MALIFILFYFFVAKSHQLAFWTKRWWGRGSGGWGRGGRGRWRGSTGRLRVAARSDQWKQGAEQRKDRGLVCDSDVPREAEIEAVSESGICFRRISKDHRTGQGALYLR